LSAAHDRGVACTPGDKFDPEEVDDAECNDAVVQAAPKSTAALALAVALAILALVSISSFGTPSGW
jgi:hypothetical protein